jgi:hypothetical protein
MKIGCGVFKNYYHESVKACEHENIVDISME